MKYRIDPKNGNEISILGYGCMRFPNNMGRIDMDKTEKLLLEAVERGINYYDTAYLYPGSEAAVGEIFEKHSIRDKVFIATKLPILMCKKTSDFDKFFNIQLERLKTTYVDYYFMHMLTTPEQWQTLCDLGIESWIESKKQSGQIRNVGFSFHGNQMDFLKIIDQYDWNFCQIQYNYINENYQAGMTGLKYASKKGMPVFIMEPLLGGKLASGLPEKAVETMKASNPDLSPVGWSLKWIWNQPEVTMLLSGMNAPEQLNENIKLAEESEPNMWSTPELTTVQEVVKIFNESYKIPCTGCNYCMPCPQNIDIPGCFAAYNTSYAIKKSLGLQQYMMNTGAINQKNPAYASTCIKCGKCESHCPQNIQIRDSLELVTKRLEPKWLKFGLSIARKVLR